MIQIKPNISVSYTCNNCGARLSNKKVLWQGIHVCVETVCPKCANEYIIDMPVGHAFFEPYVIDKKNWKNVETVGPSYSWFGKPLEESLRNPDSTNVKIKIIRKSNFDNVVIVNCIDYLYGHSLLKLFNVNRHKSNKSLGIVVIVPKLLTWMVPKYVNEIWEVNISLSRAQRFYTELNKEINNQLKRFAKVFLSKAYSHPRKINIENFTGVAPHNFSNKKFRITFVWREDRPWVASDLIVSLFNKVGLSRPLVEFQNRKITGLFKILSRELPNAKLTITGLGKKTTFPTWVDDRRVEQFNPDSEKKLCQLYSESRLVLGVHGSNMLLPSAHAGMVIDLISNWRLSNLAEDIVYDPNEDDSRVISYRYRYYPIETDIITLARHSTSMVEDFEKSVKYFKISG